MTAVFDTLLIWGIILLFSPFVLAVLYLNFILPFLREKKSIENEIDTNDGEDRIFWQNELKAFYSENFHILGRLVYIIFTNRERKG